jgi:phosphatidylglycerol:prolipoprotein diacylglycerol transferase
MLRYPDFDPVAFSILGKDVRWYSVMYMGGILFAFWFFRRAARLGRLALDARHIEGLMLTGVFGMMLGARIFYVTVYNWPFYSEHPEKVLDLSGGGLSYHGAIIGIGLATLLYAKLNKLSYLNITDHISVMAPFGIALGRLGNFINGELWGRPTDVPWAMVFPDAGPEPRHPSQLYESFLEGWLMLAIMMFLYHRFRWKPGILSGVYLMLYATMRSIGETFRQPDRQLGFLAGGLTMGQLLCLLMLAFGLGTVIVNSRRSSP